MYSSHSGSKLLWLVEGFTPTVYDLFCDRYNSITVDLVRSMYPSSFKSFLNHRRDSNMIQFMKCYDMNIFPVTLPTERMLVPIMNETVTLFAMIVSAYTNKHGHISRGILLNDISFALETGNPKLVHKCEPFTDVTRAQIIRFLNSLLNQYHIDFCIYYVDRLQSMIEDQDVQGVLAHVFDKNRNDEIDLIESTLISISNTRVRGTYVGQTILSDDGIDQIKAVLKTGASLESIIMSRLSRKRKPPGFLNDHMFSTGTHHSLYPFTDKITITEKGVSQDNTYVFTREELYTLVKNTKHGPVLNPYNNLTIPTRLTSKVKKTISTPIDSAWSVILKRPFVIDI